MFSHRPLNLSDAEKIFRHTTEAVVSKFKDPKIVYLIEASKQSSSEIPHPIVLHGSKLEFSTHLSNIDLLKNGAQDSDVKLVTCAHFCQNDKNGASVYSAEVRNIQVSLLHVSPLIKYSINVFYPIFKLHISPLLCLRVQIKSKFVYCLIAQRNLQNPVYLLPSIFQVLM